MARIRKIYEGRVEKGKMSAGDMEGKLSLVTPTLTYDDFSDVDIVIEAAPETMKIKRAVFEEVSKVVPESALFASNTSALSISEMGKYSGRPSKMIGMHFFNPAHVMKLVEIIPGFGYGTRNGRRCCAIHRVIAKDCGSGARVSGLLSESSVDALHE